MNIAELAGKLFESFPQALAEEWDRPGLSVGNPLGEVEGIATALDPLPSSIRAASASGCNVLLTHHPAFLEAPALITPSASTSSLAGEVVWTAVCSGVSLVAMHTNLDRSDAALDLCASAAGLVRTGRIGEPDGYGALLEGDGSSVAVLARRLDARLGGEARIYGDVSSVPRSVGFLSGSAGDLGRDSVERGCTCVIAGECGYHRVLDLVAAGCAVILVGHDISELAYAGLLDRTVAACAPGIRHVRLKDEPRWMTSQMARGRERP